MRLLLAVTGYVFLAALIMCGLVIAAHIWEMRGYEWEESPCICEHSIYDHQDETPDGACAVLGCNCERYRS